MKKSAVALSLMAATMATPVLAGEGPAPHGVVTLDHVWVIMMENHGYSEIIGNTNAPFINQYVTQANLATNYYAVAHPSLTNYLEVVGGSNFGVLDDNSPNWHNTSCTPNIASGVVNTEAVGTAICPIAGTGTDAATPVIDYTNETSGPPGDTEIDGVHSFAAAPNTLGITIADQLVAAGYTWKTYQESVPLTGANLVNNADGVYSNLTNFATLSNNSFSGADQVTSGGVVAYYAVKHNPFVYFASTQSGTTPGNSTANVVGFEQLYGDLASGQVPSFSFIAPNQCHDQHGKSGSDQECAYDVDDEGLQAGLNPGLIQAGDDTVSKLVTAIHNSKAWSKGHNAIVLLWDENDYYPGYINQIILTVDTNYGLHGQTSSNYYTHFSLLKSLEAGFGLPCLNHACDSSAKVMTDLFAAH